MPLIRENEDKERNKWEKKQQRARAEERYRKKNDSGKAKKRETNQGKVGGEECKGCKELDE